MDDQLRDVLMPISILGTIATGIYLFTKIMTDYILKKKMIEKGFVNDDTQAIFKQHANTDGKYSSLKWGLLVLSAGLALIILEYIDVRSDSPLPYGVLAVFISVGFLVYYFLVQKNAK